MNDAKSKKIKQSSLRSFKYLAFSLPNCIVSLSAKAFLHSVTCERYSVAVSRSHYWKSWPWWSQYLSRTYYKRPLHFSLALLNENCHNRSQSHLINNFFSNNTTLIIKGLLCPKEITVYILKF